jgi:hypothetical protein
LGKGNTLVIGAFGTLEWTFLIILVALVAAAGLFALFMLTQLFRDHARR